MPCTHDTGVFQVGDIVRVVDENGELETFEGPIVSIGETGDAHYVYAVHDLAEEPNEYNWFEPDFYEWFCAENEMTFISRPQRMQDALLI